PRSPTGVKNVGAATIGSGTTRPTTGSDTSPAASRHSRRPGPPNCDTTASSGSATSAPSVLTPSCCSRRCVSGSSGSTASGWEARNFASPPTGTMTAAPGFARVAATQETNFPRPQPTRNAKRGMRNAEQGLEERHGVGREFGPPRQFGAQREQRHPTASRGLARQVGSFGHCRVVNGTRIYPEDQGHRKARYFDGKLLIYFNF